MQTDPELKKIQAQLQGLMGWVALSSLCKRLLRPLHLKATLACRTVTRLLIEVEGTLLWGTEGMVLLECQGAVGKLMGSSVSNLQVLLRTTNHKDIKLVYRGESHGHEEEQLHHHVQERPRHTGN